MANTGWGRARWSTLEINPEAQAVLAEEVDANDYQFVIGTSQAIATYADVQFGPDPGSVTMSWDANGLDVIYDDNDVTGAAKTFLDALTSHYPDWIAGYVNDPNTINALCDCGAICKVKGHNWRGGCPGEGGIFRNADYHPNTSYRTCRMCGKTETMEQVWK